MEDKKEENRPDIIGMLRKIDDGELKVSEVDWLPFLRELLHFSELVKAPSQGFGFLYGLFAIISDFEVRKAFLLALLEASYDLREEYKQIDDFDTDCMCMADIAQALKENRYVLKDEPKAFANCFIWRQKGSGYYLGKQYLAYDELFVYYYLEPCGRKIVGLAKQLNKMAESGIQEQYISNLVRARRYDGTPTEMDNILDFCKYIYLAQGYISMLHNETENYNVIPKLVSFTKEIRESCYEEYIEGRIEQLEMSRPYSEQQKPFKKEDYYEQIYQEAKICLNHELESKGHQDFFMYDKIWLKGRQMIVDLMQYFVDYMEKKYKTYTNNTAVPAMIQTQSVTIGTNNAPITSIENSHVDLHQ